MQSVGMWAMASYTWNGNTGSYTDPAQWSPFGIPLYGTDTIVTISSGMATLSNAEVNGITLNLTAFGTAKTVLLLDNAALGPQTTLKASGYSSIEFDGYDTNYGNIVVQVPGGPGYTTLDLFANGFGQLNQYGTITVDAGAELMSGGTLNNDGLIDLEGGFFGYNSGALVGSGTVLLNAPGSFMLALGAVGAGQTFELRQGSLELYRYATFQGTVADFINQGANLTLDDLRFDAATYASDETGQHLMLTNGGVLVGSIPLSGTNATQFTVTRDVGSTIITPAAIYSDGSIPRLIDAGLVTIRNAEPNGQTVYLGGPEGGGAQPGATLVLDNAALGPALHLIVAAPTGDTGVFGQLSVVGYDSTYGEIDVPTGTRSGDSLDINIGAGSQLNQEGTIRLTSPQPTTFVSANLLVDGLGTLNNDGQIVIGPGSTASFNATVTGGGTIVVDHATAYLSMYFASQTIDFLGGRLNARLDLNATIADWNSQGVIAFSGNSQSSFPVDAVQFNQTSAAGGDLQLLKAGSQVADLHLLGSYATADFKLAPQGPGLIGITLTT